MHRWLVSVRDAAYMLVLLLLFFHGIHVFHLWRLSFIAIKMRYTLQGRTSAILQPSRDGLPNQTKSTLSLKRTCCKYFHRDEENIVGFLQPRDSPPEIADNFSRWANTCTARLWCKGYIAVPVRPVIHRQANLPEKAAARGMCQSAIFFNKHSSLGRLRTQ